MITSRELQAARTTLDLTQAELAERLGVSRTSVVNWESNGVPDRSEMKVMNAIGSAIRGIRENVEFKRFLDSRAGSDYLEQSYQSHLQMVQEDERESGAIIHGQYESKVVRNAVSLRRFDDVELLNELVRRRNDPENKRLSALIPLYARSEPGEPNNSTSGLSLVEPGFRFEDQLNGGHVRESSGAMLIGPDDDIADILGSTTTTSDDQEVTNGTRSER